MERELPIAGTLLGQILVKVEKCDDKVFLHLYDGMSFRLKMSHQKICCEDVTVEVKGCLGTKKALITRVTEDMRLKKAGDHGGHVIENLITLETEKGTVKLLWHGDFYDGSYPESFPELKRG